MSTNQPLSRPRAEVFIATTVMLSFITFWRAAAIVLSDLASSAYYAGGEAEHYIGKSAPWFILAVMLFSYAVRPLYIESSAMFVRGGVYRVVREAMGDTLAKISVSTLLFDYVLTGPISSVSAGQYLAGFTEDISRYAGHPIHLPTNGFSAVFGVLVVLYFWWKNIQGIHESSDKAMKITTVMVAILIVWCLITLFKSPAPFAAEPCSCRSHEAGSSFARMVGRHLAESSDIYHFVRWLRALGFGDERRGNTGTGQSRDRTPEVEELAKDGARDLRL